MEHVIAALLTCIAQFATTAAENANENAAQPVLVEEDAYELLLLAQHLHLLYATIHATRTAQLAALDNLEAQCFNKLSTYARDYMEEVYDTMRLFRNCEL
jgi:hypothetical protein